MQILSCGFYFDLFFNFSYRSEATSPQKYNKQYVATIVYQNVIVFGQVNSNFSLFVLGLLFLGLPTAPLAVNFTRLIWRIWAIIIPNFTRHNFLFTHIDSPPLINLTSLTSMQIILCLLFKMHRMFFGFGCSCQFYYIHLRSNKYTL